MTSYFPKRSLFPVYCMNEVYGDQLVFTTFSGKFFLEARNSSQLIVFSLIIDKQSRGLQDWRDMSILRISYIIWRFTFVGAHRTVSFMAILAAVEVHC